MSEWAVGQAGQEVMLDTGIYCTDNKKSLLNMFSSIV